MRDRNFADKKYLFLDALRVGKFKRQSGKFSSTISGSSDKQGVDPCVIFLAPMRASNND
jgi:hypothetical protein